MLRSASFASNVVASIPTGLPLHQAGIGQSLQHPREDCLVRFKIVQATCAGDRRVVGRRLPQHQPETHCGRLCFKGRKINLRHVFAGQNVGVTQVGERIWLVTFMHYDLGYFDDETGMLAAVRDRFDPADTAVFGNRAG
jgi:hypothetical protein